MKQKKPKKAGGILIIYSLPAIACVACILLLVVGSFAYSYISSKNVSSISYSDFIEAVKKNQVGIVTITGGSSVRGSFSGTGGTFGEFSTYIPYQDASLMTLLSEHNVTVTGADSKRSIMGYIREFWPLIVLLMLLWFFLRQVNEQSMRGQQFGKSRARRYDPNDERNKIVFDDVAGQQEAKRELAEIVDFLKAPTKFTGVGAKIPKGVLLVGPPGTGKTLLARAVAGEAGVSFLHISGSDFVEMFVGVGASRVRDLFEQGRRCAPCIIFIDEIDAVGRSRGAGLGGGHDEREQTLNQILVEMDGFDETTNVIVLAATNRPDVLDRALLRPGRFDRQVNVELPDVKEREAILKVHTKKVPLGEDVDLHKVARATPGMSGADLANLVNEAAIFAARKGRTKVLSDGFDEARDKLVMGLARKSIVIPEKERAMTACHESGHTLPYYYLEHCSPLHKVTIIPRGHALGVTVGLPEEDQYSHTKSTLMDRLVILYGGYAAETVVYNETTTGTQGDIQSATELAHRMVCEWGMSSEVGAVSYGKEDEPIFMGKEIARHKDYSEATAHRIDEAVNKILTEAKNRAIEILTQHRDQLDLLSKTLLEKETLSDEEIRTLLGFECKREAEAATA